MKKIDRQNVLKILNEVSDQIDWENETELVGSRIVDSLMLVSIISAISNEYDIEFDFDAITPENFNSVDAIIATIKKFA